MVKLFQKPCHCEPIAKKLFLASRNPGVTLLIKLLLRLGELSEVLRLSSEETLDSKRDTASLFQTFLILPITIQCGQEPCDRGKTFPCVRSGAPEETRVKKGSLHFHNNHNLSQFFKSKTFSEIRNFYLKTGSQCAF